MKLIHLTDLHAGDRRSAEYRNLRRGVRHIITHHRDAVVVITGDHVDNGTRAEFDVVTGLLAPLVTHCRLVLVCPGNHDVEWAGSAGFVDRQPFREFRSGLTQARASYPYSMTIDGVQIVLIDTTAQARGVDDLACGRVGYLQRMALARYLEMGTPHTRVVAGHHNLHETDPALLLRDAPEVRATMSGRADLHLQGHDHIWGIWREVDGIGWIADGGKSTEAHDGACRFRLFDITEDGISCETERVEV